MAPDINRTGGNITSATQRQTQTLGRVKPQLTEGSELFFEHYVGYIMTHYFNTAINHYQFVLLKTM